MVSEPQARAGIRMRESHHGILGRASEGRFTMSLPHELGVLPKINRRRVFSPPVGIAGVSRPQGEGKPKLSLSITSTQSPSPPVGGVEVKLAADDPDAMEVATPVAGLYQYAE